MMLLTHLCLTDGTAHEKHNPLSLVFVLPVFEGQLRYLDGAVKVGLAINIDIVHGIEDFPKAWRWGYENLGALAGHRQNTNCVLRVRLQLGTS